MMLARPTNNHVVEKKELYTVDLYRSANKKKKEKNNEEKEREKIMESRKSKKDGKKKDK